MALSLDGTTGISASGNITGGNVIASGSLVVGSFSPLSLSTAGNIVGANITTAGLISATGNITSAANIAGGNLLITTTVSASSFIGSVVSVTANVTGGNLITGGTLSVTGNIVSTGSNGVANIGSATTYFNTVHAKATSAQYADVAEVYVADQQYQPGTVLDFGGSNEVTISQASHSVKVAGVVSTNPAYIMNSLQAGANVIQLALLGRVPCRVVGPIRKGDRLVSSAIPGVAQSMDVDYYEPGCVIGKALENYDSNGIGTIEVVVGRV